MGLGTYILRRSIINVVLFFLSVSLAFFLFRLLANPVTIMIGPGLPPYAAKTLEAEFGLNKPLWIQFFIFWENFFHGNLGDSFVYTGTPVLQVIFPVRFFNTLILMSSGMFLSYLVSITLGLISGRKYGSFLDMGFSGLSVFLISIPSFLLALVILLVFGFYLGIIPLGGTVTLNKTFTSWWSYAANYLYHLVGPMVSIAIFFFASNFIIMRSSASAVFRENFIKTFEAAGVSETTILLRHGLRNAILPELSYIAVQMAYLVAGAIFTESIFSWNGMGSLIYLAIQNSDYPVLQGTFIFIMIVVIISNFIADLLYGLIDPRVRYE